MNQLTLPTGPDRVVAFDADDTLWDCQGHFERVMGHLYDMLLPWTGSREAAEAELYATERANMGQLGYGTKAFTLSVLETAMRVSRYEMDMRQLASLQQECYTLLHLPATPLPGVSETLSELQRRGERMVLFTKGELLDQEHKLERSGLGRHFSHVEITSDKGEREFLGLCRRLGVEPGRLVMVGNSLRSDIAPALAIGASAIHIPFSVTWELEKHDGLSHPRLTTIDRFDELLSLL